MQHPKPQSIWIVSVVLGLLVATSAFADDTAAARGYYQQGVDAFKADDFETALANFTEAYNLSGKPGILFNLALCQEKMGQGDRAIAYYELYLEEMPDAPDAEAVRLRIEELQNPEGTVPEPGPTAPAGEKEPEETSETASANTTNEGTSSSDAPLRVEVEPDPNGRKYNIAQGLFIGGGTLFLVTGGLTTVAAFRKYNSLETVCAPDCSDSQVKSVKRLAVAADIQMGLAIGALATGIIWKLVYRKKRARLEAQSGQAVTVGPALGHGVGGIAVTGRF
ncbi:MAG: hypothetical protein JXX14_12345 [Deltaproteobacteria bacterium]|nr:hypothetical protein [Deltaproteobacteria bacterium]